MQHQVGDEDVVVEVADAQQSSAARPRRRRIDGDELQRQGFRSASSSLVRWWRGAGRRAEGGSARRRPVELLCVEAHRHAGLAAAAAVESSRSNLGTRDCQARGRMEALLPLFTSIWTGLFAYGPLSFSSFSTSRSSSTSGSPLELLPCFTRRPLS